MWAALCNLSITGELMTQGVETVRQISLVALTNDVEGE